MTVWAILVMSSEDMDVALIVVSEFLLVDISELSPRVFCDVAVWVFISFAVLCQIGSPVEWDVTPTPVEESFPEDGVDSDATPNDGCRTDVPYAVVVSTSAWPVPMTFVVSKNASDEPLAVVIWGC